jgi:hypothetical protein
VIRQQAIVELVVGRLVKRRAMSACRGELPGPPFRHARNCGIVFAMASRAREPIRPTTPPRRLPNDLMTAAIGPDDVEHLFNLLQPRVLRCTRRRQHGRAYWATFSSSKVEPLDASFGASCQRIRRSGYEAVVVAAWERAI